MGVRYGSGRDLTVREALLLVWVIAGAFAVFVVVVLWAHYG